jgi:hypothetical protein
MILQVLFSFFSLAMQSCGFFPNTQVFLVLLAQWNHTDPIPNSVVKRCCGEDTWRVAAWDNSSVPGFYSISKNLLSQQKGGF